MSAQTLSYSATVRSGTGLVGWIRRHPLPAYFIWAYAATWVFVAPILLSQMGLKIVELPDALLLVFFFIATYSGPLPAALIVTGLTEGRAGIKHLLRRMVQWRAGLRWYALAIFGYPLVYLAAYSFLMGAEPFNALIQKWPLLLTAYLPQVLVGILWPGLGEEPGWRGFALPRLQRQFGPLPGSLILGTLHAFWHLPVYFIPGLILQSSFDLNIFIANTCGIIAVTIIWTWLVNNARGSVFMAMLIHAVSNANSGFLPRLLTLPHGVWFGFAVMAVCALLVLVATRGRLSYVPERESLR